MIRILHINLSMTTVLKNLQNIIQLFHVTTVEKLDIKGSTLETYTIQNVNEKSLVIFSSPKRELITYARYHLQTYTSLAIVTNDLIISYLV